MPDISMCQNKECQNKEKCYRYKALPSTWQSYMKFDPKEDNCFMKLRKESN
jgi:hypothetical protein